MAFDSLVRPSAVRLAALSLLVLAAPLAAQGPDPREVSPERLGETMQELCATPRLAGTPGSFRAGAYAAKVFGGAGLTVEEAHYQCHLPRQTGQSLAFLGPEAEAWFELSLEEQGFEEDPRTLADHLPPMHGLTAPGEAEGAVWYVGYGTEREFAALERKHGEAIRGGIALVRYGMLYRGLKVANAEKYGFAGALLYTDEEEDGYPRGKVLPEGPWRPASGIQRGSVYNADGDPLTPGWAAVEGAPRISLDETVGRVGIPSLPISATNSARLRAGAGKVLGPMPTRARIMVEQDPTPVDIVNVLGRIEGAVTPDEWVIVGAHRDSWGYGAVDNATGSTVLLETARVFGAAFERGWRPERTLIFATWDAEEWGLVGSTEWVEEHLGPLREKAVAYVNMDVVATGPNFSASCTPGMVDSLAEACARRGVPMPGGVGVPGGGSDHVPFLELGGIEVLTFGFHGGSGVYHSALDTPWLIETFLDPGYRHHAEAASFAVTVLEHLSRADTIVDGRRRWLQQVLTAAERLPREDEAQELARLMVLNAAESYALRLAREDDEPGRADAFRFARHFLPADGRSFLWRSAGYGSAWFPDLQAALTPGAAARTQAAAGELVRAFDRAKSKLEDGAEVGR